MNKSTFDVLHTIDLNSELKNIQGNKYLPWNRAWSNLCKSFPNATYYIHESSECVPYFESRAGLFVKVSVTIDDITHTMIRPVYDLRNLSMRIEPRQVQYGNRMVDVNGATANDINDSIMRCLTKTIAMHGLGIYIFEDKPYADAELIDSSQISEISSLISKHNLNMSDLNKVFGINRLSELIAMNYDGAISWINDTAS